MAPIAGCWCRTTPKPRTGCILGYVAQNRIPKVPSPPATPYFLWFPHNHPTRRLGPHTGGQLVEPEGSPGRARWGHTVGANGGYTGALGAKKKVFSKVVPRPLGMLKQVQGLPPIC